MMQSTEISAFLKSTRLVNKIVLFAMAFFNLVSASTQLDIRAGGVSGEIKPESGEYVGGLIIQQNYNGLYALSPKLDLMLENRFDGLKSLYWDKEDVAAMRNYPLKEKRLPSSNLASAGIRWTGLGDAQLNFRNILYLNPLTIDPFYLEYMDTTYTSTAEMVLYSEMSRKARTYANAYWSLPLGRATVTADLNLIFFKYQKRFFAFDPEPVDSSIFHNNDLWSDYTLSYRMFNDVYIQFNTRLKQNLSDSKFFNLYRYQVELNGTAQFPRMNQLTWNGGLEQYQRSSDEDMNGNYRKYVENHYPMATRLLFYLYLRDVVTISRGFYLKGTTFFETGTNLLKLRYEISLRKAWRNLSYLEPGYCTSLGGLFPIQSAYVKSRIQATKSFSIDPAVKFSWEATENTKKHEMEVSFLKSVSSLELTYAIRKQIQILLGGNYTYFDKDVARDDFPSRFGLYCGLQSIIP